MREGEPKEFEQGLEYWHTWKPAVPMKHSNGSGTPGAAVKGSSPSILPETCSTHLEAFRVSSQLLSTICWLASSIDVESNGRANSTAHVSRLPNEEQQQPS